MILTFSEHGAKPIILPTKEVRRRNCPLTAVTVLLVATTTVLIVTVIVLVSLMMTTKSPGTDELY